MAEAKPSPGLPDQNPPVQGSASHDLQAGIPAERTAMPWSWRATILFGMVLIGLGAIVHGAMSASSGRLLQHVGLGILFGTLFTFAIEGAAPATRAACGAFLDRFGTFLIAGAGLFMTVSLVTIAILERLP